MVWLNINKRMSLYIKNKVIIKYGKAVCQLALVLTSEEWTLTNNRELCREFRRWRHWSRDMRRHHLPANQQSLRLTFNFRTVESCCPYFEFVWAQFRKCNENLVSGSGLTFKYFEIKLLISIVTFIIIIYVVTMNIKWTQVINSLK